MLGNELTDETQFYTWAGNKAQILANTYIIAHVSAKADEDTKIAKDMRLSEL